MKFTNRYIAFTLFIIVVILQFNCANQSPPTGGPKDETPPNLISMYPEDGELNFKDNKIELLFDEKVDAIDVKKELIISPNVNIDFRVKSQKNAVIVQFENELPDSTTFSIDFRTSIKDITEKNESEPIKLAFSTGPYIDTLNIIGTVKDKFTNTLLQDILVGIYDINDTLSIEEDEPIYFTRTDSAGQFTLSNIRVGEYKIYSLSEKDNSLTYNKSDELVGFLSDSFSLIDTSLMLPSLSLLNYNEKEFELIKNNSRRQYAELIFSKNLIDYRVTFTDTTLNDMILHSFNENTITFYDIGDNTIDSISITYIVTDSISQQISDNINIKFNETENKATPVEFKSNFFPIDTQLIEDSLYNIELEFNKPIALYYLDSILLTRGKSDTLSLSNKITANHNKTKFSLAQIKAEDSLALLIKKGAFISVENDSIEKISKNFSLKDPEEFSVLRVGIKSNESSFIIQLLNETFNVEQEYINEDSVEFQFITPGNKFLRLIVDENNNGKWDKGSFKERIAPEEFIFYPDTIKLKKNWDIGGYNITIPSNK